VVEFENNDRRSALSYGARIKYGQLVRRNKNAVAETPYRPKSVFIRILKRTEHIVPEIFSMPFSFFVESDETRTTGLPDGQKVLI